MTCENNIVVKYCSQSYLHWNARHAHAAQSVVALHLQSAGVVCDDGNNEDDDDDNNEEDDD